MKDKDEAQKNSSVYHRPGSAMYNLMEVDREKQKKTLAKWKLANKYFVVPLYKIGLLSLLGIGRIFILLTTIGRNSGKERTTPLEYHKIGGKIHIFSGRGGSDWLKNLKANPDKVWVRAGFQRFKPQVQAILDGAEKFRILKWCVEKNPTPSKKLFGWNPEKDDPDSDDLKQFAKFIPIIKLKGHI